MPTKRHRLGSAYWATGKHFSRYLYKPRVCYFTKRTRDSLKGFSSTLWYVSVQCERLALVLARLEMFPSLVLFVLLPITGVASNRLSSQPFSFQHVSSFPMSDISLHAYLLQFLILFDDLSFSPSRTVPANPSFWMKVQASFQLLPLTLNHLIIS